MKVYKLLLLFLTVTISTYAQVSVHLQQPPPYQFKVEQFWKIILINNSKSPMNVYLKGTATESGQGKIIEATSSVISLQPGVRNISGRDLGPFTISESNSRYKNIILNTGGLPSGNYEICVGVFAATDGLQIATDCISVTVENFNRMELISPFDGEVISDVSAEAIENLKIKSINKTPSIVFSWLPPVPVPPDARITYRLKLVELLGYQSIYSAMASNPMYYQSPNISATVLRYPIAARQLTPGRKYAWAVEAYANDFKIQESEIRSFEIQGGEESKIRYDVSNAGTTQYSEIFINGKSGLPSGLSSYKSNNYGTSALKFFGTAAPIDILGEPTNLKFTGDAKFTQTSSSKPTQYSQLPLNYQMLTINPRLSMYDIPFGFNISLTSLKGSSNQSLNSVAFILDVDRLKSKIKDRISEKVKEAISSADSSLGKLDLASLSDPNKLAETAEKLGLISPAEKLFLNIKTLGIGRTYPEYSALTVSGVPVNGVNLELNPGLLYFEIAAGKNLDGIDEVSFKRSFLAGRIGIGEKENAHLFFTLLKMKDNDQSILPPVNVFLTPQENQVIGTEGKIFLFNHLLALSGEGAVSMFTRDIRDADIQDGSLPGFVKNIYDPKLSSTFDYAFSGSAVFDQPKNDTYFSFDVNRIGPGYISLAAPNIRSDQLMFQAKLNKKFSDKKVSMKTFVKIYQDNTTNWKASTTTTASFGVSFDFNFPKMPYFSLGYSPYFQGNDAVPENQIIRNDNHIVNFMTGYSYQLSGIYATTMFAFNGQWQNAKLGLNSNKFSNTSYMLNQSFNFEFPLTLSSTFSLAQSKILSISSSITDFDLNGNYQICEKISANLGGTISKEENYTNRTMIYLGSNILISQWLRFELQVNLSKYKDLSGGGKSYNDGMLQASAVINW